MQKLPVFGLGGVTLDVFNNILDMAKARQLDLEKPSRKLMQEKTKLYFFFHFNMNHFVVSKILCYHFFI